MDGEIRLSAVPSGVQRRSGQCLALPVPMLLEWRRRVSDTVHRDAHYRRAASHVHGTFLR